jgi:Fe-S oxidoreductase, related to NifB/MoaA family
MPVTVSSTESGSLAHRSGIERGDKIISINGNEINDILDYRFYETERRLTILVEKSDGSRREISIRKGEYDSLGVECGTYLMDKQRSCRNKCVFCFIDQLPKGMRKSLYFKDDDDRLSFLFGNYITLTNIDEREISRIIKMRISPVNISVHTTNPELRVKMMKNPHAGEVLRFIPMLAEGGIHLNCQIVLCPEWNDGEELDRTLRDLTSLCPAVQSVAVVPVGLTRHREGLEKLRMFTPEECCAVIDQIEAFGDSCVERFGGRIVYASDEFYLNAGREIRGGDFYEDYAQLENGVGMVSLLRGDFTEAVEEEPPEDIPYSASIACGVSIAPILKDLLDLARKKWHNANWKVYPIVNHFFGERITVSGLITGHDLMEQLQGKELGGRLLISSSMLDSTGRVFLDDFTVEEIENALGVSIRAVSSDGYELLDALRGM